jgi:hypothetical protein
VKSIRVAVVWLVLGAGCGSEHEPLAASAVAADLSPGIAARVGDETIATELVQRVSQAQRISPTDARELLIQSALWAMHARSQLAAPGALASAERGALSRALLERLQAEARAGGEPTDDEVRRIVAARWLELDRPAAAKTSHAVVLLDQGADRALAKRVAERIATAVRGAKDAAEFRELATAVPTDGARVRVEELPAVTADGRVVPDDASARQPAAQFDPTFAAAANALAAVGDQSGIVESSHGLHVIVLQARHPELRVAPEKRRELVRAEAITERARELESKLVGRLARETPVQVDRAADALTAMVQVRP